jgi:hypothetical protein
MDLAQLKPWRRAQWLTILRCLQAQVGVHALDAADAAAGSVGPEGLKVGVRTYRTILAPAVGLMTGAAFRRLQEAAAAGVRVVWFGGGPAKLAEPSGALLPAPAPAGEVRRENEPSLAWCRKHLPAQAAVRGEHAGECYVRRFRAEDGTERLFAVNIAQSPRAFTLADEESGVWQPDPALADGDTVRRRDGLRWSVPAGGCGMFTLIPAIACHPTGRAASPLAAVCVASSSSSGRQGTAGPALKIQANPGVTIMRPAAKEVGFERVGPNTLRLDRCRLVLKGRPPQDGPYPQPFWQRFQEYCATEVCHGFGGDMPVESTVAESDLRYQFTFESSAPVKGAELVLDPRCARGRFRVFMNGRKVSDLLAFPLPHITPLRVALPNVKRGRNQVELRFDVQNAMEGLLSPIRIEGAFGVWLKKGSPVVKPDSVGAVSSKGWLDMGLAHYMGDGVYRWTERLSADDLAGGNWMLELDEITDSALLRVNGLDLGTRAWAPWRWSLSALKPGDNTFELTVSSTAGNRLSLLYPAQPQGWIGKGRLARSASG